MKKLFLAILFLGLAVGSQAASIPLGVEPANGGPELWLQSVYVASGSTALDVGDVVCWDGDSSTGDDDSWVEQCSTLDTYLVAGVVYPIGIAAGSSGTIAIKGPVQVDAVPGHLTVAPGLACASATAGSAASCSTTAANFGIVVTANTATGTSAVVCVNCNK